MFLSFFSVIVSLSLKDVYNRNDPLYDPFSLDETSDKRSTINHNKFQWNKYLCIPSKQGMEL